MKKDCNNCAHKDKHPHEQPCSLCTAKGDLPPTRWEPDGTDISVLTNADRIRAMSDEELAKFLRWDICPRVRGEKRMCSGWCDECVLEWLKQPVKEDA